MQPFNPPLPIREGGLTPASAWIGPRVAPSFAPGNPDPLAYATTELAAAPPPPPPPPVMTAPARTMPVAPVPPRVEAPVAAASATVVQPVYAPPAEAPAAASTTTAADPMAPRPDAPIFRLRSQAASAPAQTQTAPSQSAPVEEDPVEQAPVQTTAAGQAPARYYSVHRAAGRQPDRAVMPEPVFFDSVALDLAQPPETEPVRRDAQGRRIPVANADPSLP
jgi:hypothetical protein